jgi:hypothetical protein
MAPTRPRVSTIPNACSAILFYLLISIKGLRPNGILECWKNGIMGLGLMD